ncbi:hypothetical protein [Streptomyces sp. NPDC056160]|uniref:hypothetical protein n=1 Tax=Streptomyces sp. NPDC056160 TaxID=3345731 RepID=UPI0035DE9752
MAIGRRHTRARAAIAVVESVLAERIGAAGVGSLWHGLTADRGEPPLPTAPRPAVRAPLCSGSERPNSLSEQGR